MKKKDDAVQTEIQILEIRRGVIELCLVGEAPLLLNKMSEKAKRELLLPRGRLSEVQKRTSLKHDPLREFRDSAHKITSEETLLAFPSSGFKAAMTTAALDLPGTKKSQIGRWCFVEGEYTPIYGIPKFFMTTVRMADMNRTPDIRSLCIVPQWAAKIKVSYVSSFLKPNAVANLVAAGGVYVGIGDGRPEKLKLSFGRYRVVESNDPDFIRITTSGGRQAQLKAMEDAIPYDLEVANLYEWYENEIKSRNFEKSTKAKVLPDANKEPEAESVAA